MSVADYAYERDKRSATFTTETKKLEDFSDFIGACSQYMQSKKIDKIKITLNFDFIEPPEEEKKKLIQ